MAEKMPLTGFEVGSLCGTEYGALGRMRATVLFRGCGGGKEGKKQKLEGLNFFHKHWVKKRRRERNDRFLARPH